MREHTRAGRRAYAAALVGLCFVTAVFAAQARTIRVPADVATIQGAIDAAVTGDRVLVSPGTYLESIDFNGKAISVVSDKGADVTIIDAGGQRSVARFHTGETRRSVLKGFTLRNGNAIDYPLHGGGVQIYEASPTIDGNVITGSSSCSGNGISIDFSSALVRNNHVHNNRQNGCGGGTVGGGILIGGEGAAEVTDNLIENNQTDLAGGGIGMNSAGTPLIGRNVIRNNVAGNLGGGLSAYNGSRPTVVSNLIHGNTAPRGGGVGLSVPASFGGTWVNNTIADNVGQISGSEIYTEGFVDSIEFINNIVRTSTGPVGIECDPAYSTLPPIFINNDLFATVGTLLIGSCSSALSSGGNISVDPQFAREGRRPSYRLTAGSPAVDAGAPTALAGSTDAAGRPRVVDGNSDGNAVIDLGAYEFKSLR